MDISLILFLRKTFSSRTRIITFSCVSLLLLCLPGGSATSLEQTLPVLPDTHLMVGLPPLPAVPAAKGIPLPALTAKGAVVLDVTSYAVLFDHQAAVSFPPASTTKIMTALVVLEEYPLDEVVTVNQTNRVIGSTSKVNIRSQWTVEQLLHALLISSGNDAAVYLAEHYPAGYQGFVQRMNERAQELSLTTTHFNNVSGLDSFDHYSSARDLAQLALVAMRQPLFRQIVATQQTVISDITNSYQLPLVSTNQLLGTIPGVTGVKTGQTLLAGECLVTFVERDGHPLLIVVLGSQDRFGETTALIDWAYANHVWIQP